MGLLGKAVGRTNWNIDFVVEQPYRSFKLFFTADSNDPSSYPIQAFLKFSDGSNLKVTDEQLQQPVATCHMFGSFQQVASKTTSQVNFRIGANKDPQATGFSYRIRSGLLLIAQRGLSPLLKVTPFCELHP